jgi:hypothetical protein|eukprot:COSAG02_NODE_2262_length_9317_cov_21.181927_3_plen_64_part_00
MGCSSEVARVWLTFCVPSGWCVTWYPAFSLCSTPGHSSLPPCLGCCTSPCALLVANLTRLLLL